MLRLYGLPGLPKTRPDLRGYSAGLRAMYSTNTAGSAVSLRCFNPSTGNPPSSQGKYASVHYLQSLLQPGHVPPVTVSHPYHYPHPGT